MAYSDACVGGGVAAFRILETSSVSDMYGSGSKRGSGQQDRDCCCGCGAGQLGGIRGPGQRNGQQQHRPDDGDGCHESQTETTQHKTWRVSER
jgi:hypothetical protein